MKALIFTLITCTGFSVQASIVCHTPRMNHHFEINDNRVSFFSEDSMKKNRDIASIASRSKNDLKGMTKIVDFEDQKHTIHIEDSNHFSDVNDYIVIRNKVGHEITYPLTCNLK